MVACEAFATVFTNVDGGTDKSPLGDQFPIQSISPSRINIVPILRSGLSMVDPVAALLPFPVPVNHLGMFRRAGPSSKLEAVEYYNNLSDHKNSASSAADEGYPADLAIIVDPIIATGVTCLGAIESLRDYGAKRIVVLSVLCAAPGITAVAESADNVEIWVGHCDPGTDEKGMIRPGIGDVGDRLFLTVGK